MNPFFGYKNNQNDIHSSLSHTQRTIHYHRTFRYHRNYTNVMASDENQQLSAEALREIEECEKIVELWEEVMDGRHPHIKIPPHLVSFSRCFN
jgi:hypothetical protein